LAREEKDEQVGSKGGGGEEAPKIGEEGSPRKCEGTDRRWNVTGTGGLRTEVTLSPKKGIHNGGLMEL